MSEEQPGVDPFQQDPHAPHGNYDPQANYYQTGYQQPGYQQHYQQQHYGPQYGYQPIPVGNDSKGMGITSMILGISSFVVPLIGFLLAIGAVILGFMSRSREPSAQGFAIAGLITGFVSLAFSILLMLLFGGVFLTFFSIGLAS